ncbi:sigma-E processing peptidase SpoIIGA [Agathobacter sp.]
MSYTARTSRYTLNESEVNIIYAFYLDIFLFRTFITNTLILIFVTYILKIPLYGKIKRILLSGALSTALEIILLLCLKNYSLYKWLSFLIVGPLTVSLAIKCHMKPFRLWALGVFATLLTGGVVYAMDSLISADMTLICGGGFIITYLILVSWCEQSSISRGLYRVMLVENGKRLYITAFYDSGNMLRRSPGNIPVHIGSETVFELVGDDKEYVDVPYRSLGNEDGRIKACFFEEMIVEDGSNRRVFENVLIGRASANLLKNSAYDMILNEAVFSDSKGMECDLGEKIGSK